MSSLLSYDVKYIKASTILFYHFLFLYNKLFKHFSHFEKYSSKLDISRSFICTFAI